MRISLDRLSATPTAFAFEGDARWWRGSMPAQRGLPEDFAEPFRFALEAYEMGEDIYIEGSASGSLELECSRCLARYRHEFCEPIRLVLEPAGERIPAEPEGAKALSRDGVSLGDELETGWFRGAEIDLGPFFLEVVTLAMPVKPLCRDDCKGLCPRCGADQNTGRCDCTETRADSPFAVLAKLKLGSKEGES